jgi:hypothetical protein
LNNIRLSPFDNDRLFYFVLALAVVPLWITTYLPGVDLPGHAAQGAALAELWRQNEVFTSLFEFNSATPYLTATVILGLLCLVLPASIAVKIMMTAVFVATPVLAGRLIAAVGGDQRWKWLIIPSVYSFAFSFGFLPFIVAVPIGLGFLLLTVRFSERPGIGLGLAVAAYSLLLLASHLLVLCYSSMLALAYIIGSNYKNIRRTFLLCLPYSAPLPLIGLWLKTTLSSGTYMSAGGINFGPMLLRLKDVVVQPSGLDGNFIVVSFIVTGVIIGLPMILGASFTRNPARWAMALSGAVVFMAFPSFWIGTAFLYERFGLYLPLLWFLVWDTPESGDSRWQWLGVLAVLLWASVNVLRFSAFDLETRDFRTVTESIGPGKRVGSLVAAAGSSQFRYMIFMHFPSWYQADQRGVVDYNFGKFYGTVVRYQSDKQPNWGPDIGWDPAKFDWNGNNGENYDYFIVRSDVDAGAQIFKSALPRVSLVAREGWWWVYRKNGQPLP